MGFFRSFCLNLTGVLGLVPFEFGDDWGERKTEALSHPSNTQSGQSYPSSSSPSEFQSAIIPWWMKFWSNDQFHNDERVFVFVFLLQFYPSFDFSHSQFMTVQYWNLIDLNSKLCPIVNEFMLKCIIQIRTLLMKNKLSQMSMNISFLIFRRFSRMFWPMRRRKVCVEGIQEN